jgi:ribose/xylose/arabinose/galactoside ABC-type transport system permease subunit
VNSSAVIALGRKIPSAVYVLAALGLVLAIVVPRFATAGNLINLLRVAGILAMASYGQAIVIITAGLDFSIGSSVALTSVVTVLLVEPLGTPLAFACGGGAALALGAINGILIGGARLPPFLVTLGMLIFVHGLASLLVGGVPLEAPAGMGMTWLGKGTILGIPTPIILAVLGFVALSVLLRRTIIGRHWYLAGASARSARLAGVPVGLTLFLAYVMGSAFVAVAGLVLTSRVGSGQPYLFPTLPFEAIAACAIGGLPLTGGAGRPIQVVAGVLILTAAENAVVLLNVSSAAQLIIVGSLMVGAVAFQQLKWRPYAKLRLAGAGRGDPQPSAVRTQKVSADAS